MVALLFFYQDGLGSKNLIKDDHLLDKYTIPNSSQVPFIKSPWTPNIWSVAVFTYFRSTSFMQYIDIISFFVAIYLLADPYTHWIMS